MVMPISGLDRVTIAGRWAKAFIAPLQPGVDVLRVMSLRSMPGPWTDAPLPFDLQAGYQQEVNPYAWSRCAIFLAYLVSKGSTDARIPGAIALLRDKLAAFSENGLFQYRFAKTFTSGLKPTSAPWVSALGNAYIVAGALELFVATQDNAWGEIAHRHVVPLMAQAADTDLVCIDASSWLWLEETPAVTRTTSATPERTHVLNGHVGALFVLYHWLQATGPDPVIDLHVRAAAATAATYYDRTRNPGAIMDYWLLDKTPDYGPVRAVNYVTALGQITGNPIFSYLRDAFLTDVPVVK